MSIFINKIINNSNSLFKKNKRHYERERSKLEDEFNRKFKYTYKYYLNNMPRNALDLKKQQLIIDYTSIRIDRIKNIEAIVADGSKQLIIRDKYSTTVKISKTFLNFLLICASLYVYGLAIYKIALYFLEKFNL